MNDDAPILDFSRPDAWPGLDPSADQLGLGWAIDLCPTCETGIPVQVLESGRAVIVQFCDACSSRLAVDGSEGQVTGMIDVDDLAPWGLLPGSAAWVRRPRWTSGSQDGP